MYRWIIKYKYNMILNKLIIKLRSSTHLSLKNGSLLKFL